MSGLSIADGSTYYLRWTFTGLGGSTNGQGVGLDNFSITATASTTSPAITGAATATSFTTTYGTASTAQTFPISGTNLTANITATAPTGFEVASDGTTYGSTATFIQSSGTAGGTLSVRLAATASATGSYNDKSVALISAGAPTVNITTAVSGNTVSAKALSITGVSGVAKTYDGNTGASLSGTAAYVGLVNGESFSVTGTPVATFASPSVGNIAITVTGYTAPSPDYTVTQPTGLLADINAKALSVAANDLVKPYGDTLTSGAGKTAFTPSGLVSPETIGSVTLTYTSGGAASDVPGSYPGSIVASAATGGTFAASNYTISYVAGNLTVTASPTVSVAGTLAAVDTTYGSASATPTSFTTSGANLMGDLTVTAPTGFEISTSIGSGYAGSLNLTAAGNAVATTTIYVRLAATSAVGTYSGNVTVASSGATTQSIATLVSTVAPVSLTITGLSGVDKQYDRNTTATLSGAPELNGVLAGDSGNVTLSGTPAADFGSASAGTAKPIAVTGYTLAGTASANYTVVQPSVTANITQAPLTVTGAAVTSKPHDGNTNATITGTLSGVIAPDVVSFIGTGTFASSAVGNGIAVTSNSTLGGAAAGNYALTQPTGLTGNITAALPTAETVAYWNFNTLSIATASVPGSGGVPTSISASQGTGTISLTGFAGNVDDFAGSDINSQNASPAEESLSLVAGGSAAPFPGNGGYLELQLNLADYANPVVTFATRGTASGFSTGTWSYSVAGGSFTTIAGVNTASVSTTFALAPTVDLSSIDAVDGQSNVRLRYTVSGATSSTGNNRIDNLHVAASRTNDSVAPIANTFAPADNATSAPITSTPSIVFNEPVQKGAVGDILIKRSSDNSLFETIAITSSQVTVSSATVTITPSVSFAYTTGYYLEIPAGAFEDLAGNDYAGISGASAWNFTTLSESASPIATKTFTTQTRVTPTGASPSADYYAEGNGQGTFALYGFGTFNFSKLDFGLSGASTITGVTTAEFTLTNNDRTFSAGTELEFFLTTDSSTGKTFNSALVNGIDNSQYSFAPISLGKFPYTPATTAAQGGIKNTFTLNLSGAGAALISRLNTGEDFSIILAVTEPAAAVTYSGKGNTFDPGDPELKLTVAETTGVDTTPPTVAFFTPADGAGGLPISSNIKVSFNELIQKGSSGSIMLYRVSDDSVFETINVTSSQVTTNLGTVTIDPVNALESAGSYYVQITPGAIEDVSGNDFTGIADNTTWNFSTAQPPITATGPFAISRNAPAGTVVGTLNPNVNGKEGIKYAMLGGSGGTSLMNAIPGAGYLVSPFFTMGDTIENSTGALNATSAGNFSPPGTPDGMGAFSLNANTVRVFFNHEIELPASGSAAYPYTLANGTVISKGGARITYIDIDKTSRRVVDGGLAIARMYDRSGNVVTSASQLELGGLDRMCSASLYEPNLWGSGRGLVDRMYITGEETSTSFGHPHGGTYWALDTASGDFWALPDFGRGSWENAALVDTGTTTHVAFLFGDDSPAVPLYLYVGQKSTAPSANFVERNGLVGGQLYVWKATNGNTTPQQFNGTGSTRTGTWVAINAKNAAAAGSSGHDAAGYKNDTTLENEADSLGAFSFSRPEDLSASPTDGSIVAFASTGRGSVYPLDNWGDTYVVDNDFTNLAAPTASIRILYDGDDAGNGQFMSPEEGLRCPDNLDWADDGFIYVQEDQSNQVGSFGAAGEETSIWRLDSVTGQAVRVAQTDRSTVLPLGSTDGNIGDFGNWESSGIVDVSSLFGQAGGTLFLFDIQAHSITNGLISSKTLFEGGQLCFLERNIERGAFALNPNTGVLTLANPAALEGMTTCELRLQAYDGTNSTLDQVTVNITNTAVVATNNFKVATFNTSLYRDTDNTLINDLATVTNSQAQSIARIIQRNNADVILINEFDYDARGKAVRRFKENYLEVGQSGESPVYYPYAYFAPVNTGVHSGFDLDNNGSVVSTPGASGYGEDAFGFGTHPGEYGLVVLSKFPIDAANARTFQKFLWKDMPGALLPDNPNIAGTGDWYSPAELNVFRLSSKTHMDVPVLVNGAVVHILASHPTPPVFDEGAPWITGVDHNGRRNSDEIRFWSDYVNPAVSTYIYDDTETSVTASGGLPANSRFVMMGDQNADNDEGDSTDPSIKTIIGGVIGGNTVTGNPLFNPFVPGGGAGPNPDDTAAFSGGVRVDYVLASSYGLQVQNGAVFWPSSSSGDPILAALSVTDHHLVYLNLSLTGVELPPSTDLVTYYTPAQGLAGASLQSALHSIIDSHVVIDYGTLDEVMQVIDETSPGSGQVRLLYSNATLPKTSNNISGGWNREHVWPRSDGVGDNGPDYSDLHHLFPCKDTVNSLRSNLPFDESTSVLHTDPFAPESSSDGNSWEPLDRDKGIVARAQLYMMTRYDGTEAFTVDLLLADNTSPTGTQGVLSTLLAWHRAFPPTDYERSRNNAIYAGATVGAVTYAQGNRNPFIDFPQFVDAIYLDANTQSFGKWQTQKFSLVQLASSSTSSSGADPDGDLFDNHSEFYFRGNPNAAGDTPLALARDGDVVTLTFHRPKGVAEQAQLQSSTSLPSWTPVSSWTSSSAITDLGDYQRIVYTTDVSALVGAKSWRVIFQDSGSNTVATSNVVSTTNAQPSYTLQILHYYGESGLLGTTTAPILGAMIDRFDDQYSNTVVLGEGDSYIPGPWLIGGADPSLNTILHTGTFTSAAATTAVAFAQADIAIMNAFGTTASALGNHEFDLGSPVLQAALFPANSSTVGNWAGAQFPLITANLDFNGDSSLKSRADATLGGTGGAIAGLEVTAMKAKIAPYAIKTLNGQKIGFVGATTYDLLSKTSPNGTVPKDDANPSTSDLQEVAAYIQSAVNSLQALGVNKIIMVDQLDTLERNKLLAPMLTGIDVMVAGGGHERMGDSTDTAVAFNGHDADFISDAYPILTAGSDGKPTLIVTSDTEYSYLGRLVLDFDTNGEIVVSSLSTAINGAYASTEASLQAAYATSNTAAQIIASSTIGSTVKAITDAINTVITAKDGTFYGYTDVYLEGDRVFGRTQEVNLGNISADANGFKAKAALGLSSTAAVFSLKNGGGVRASVGSIDINGVKIGPAANSGTGKPQGAISQLDVENALRFDNKLMVCDMTPAGLLNILNFAAGLSTGPSNQNGGYPQVGNIRFSYDSAQPAGQKVRTAVLINDNDEIVSRIIDNGVVRGDAPSVIKAVVLNFTMNGGDGYPIKANASNFRYLLTDGTVTAPISSSLDFTAAANVPANALGEQKAFQDYLLARYATPASAFNVADTPVAQDARIQQLAFRSDTVNDGAVVASVIAFGAATYSVDQGSTSVALTVNRSGGATPVSVTINTADGTTSTVPPFAAGLAGTDYTSLTGAATTLNFAQDEVSKTVNVTLVPKTALNTPNKRFTVNLSTPTASAELGTVSTATVRILAANSTSPALKIITPASVLDSAAWPYLVKGTAGSALGIDRVEVALNGAPPVIASLGGATSNLVVPWSLGINPIPGLNTMVATVFDLSGNSSSVRRTFTFTRRYAMTLTRFVPGAVSATPDTAGTVAMIATPATAASALAPATANTNPKSANIVPGTVVKLSATAKVGYVFSHWSGTPVGAVNQGNVTAFIMPAGDTGISATFIANPFSGPAGAGNVFYGLIHPQAGTATNNATEGYLTGTLTTSSGLFSGKVLIDGVSQALVATFYGDGSSIFTVGTARQPSLNFGGKTLTLAYAGGAITATVVNGANTSTGTATRAIYSSTNLVPAALLNSATKGFYTIGFPSKAQIPAALASTYPQGDGFGTLSVTNLGVVTLTGTLADGTAVTASSALVADNDCPIFVQLTTPGAAATVKGSSFGGVLTFNNVPADSDVSGTDLLWLRPAVTAVTTPAAAALATNLYTDGWPSGIHVDAVGALYAASSTVQTTLGTAVTGSANAQVMLTDGKLNPDIIKSNLNISGNAATKIPASDASYTLIFAPTTGGFSGTFTPNWASPSSVKPAYRGILIQKGASKGGYGFFLSNAIGDLDPESGGVTLSKQP